MLRLNSGQWPTHSPDDLCATASNGGMTILYSSDHFIVIDKRYDLKVNSDDEKDKVTVSIELGQLYPNLVDIHAAHGFRFIHRLDYATSGCLCIALTKTGARYGNKAFAKRYVTKHYVALVRGHLNSETQRIVEINAAIGFDSSVTDVHKMCVSDELISRHADDDDLISSSPTGVCRLPRDAQTRMILLQHGEYDGRPVSKVLLIPHTGRTHQLRVHSRHIGHPVVGDYMYSDRVDAAPYRMMLHALRLVIPMKRETIDVVAPDPLTPELDPLWVPTETFETYAGFICT